MTGDSIGDTNYAILDCHACGGRFMAKMHRYQDDNWVPVYPIPQSKVADEIPEPVKDEFKEANLCFAVGAYRASVATCEIALEALWRLQKCKGLNDLKDRGIISESLFNRATEVRLWANIAKHETLPDAINPEDAEEILRYLGAILESIYVEQARLDALKQKREAIDKGKGKE
jgi:hypothetical protein